VLFIPEATVHRLMPKSRMGIFALVVIALWVLKTIFFTPALRNSFPILGLLLDLLTPLLAIPAVYYTWKLFKSIRNQLLWKIRRRLILAHIFIGAIPVFLVISIFYFSALLIYYQLSYYLISNQIGIHAAQIHAFNLALRDEMQELIAGKSTPTPADLKQTLDSGAKFLLGSYPSATIIFRFPDPGTNQDQTYINQNPNPGWIKDYEVPRWLVGREFNGLVMEDMQPKLYKQKLFLRSFISDQQSDFPFSIEVSVPFDGYFLGRLKAVLGQDLLLADRVRAPGLDGMLRSTDVMQENIIESTFESEKTQSIAGTGWPIYLFPISWITGMDQEPSESEVLLVELSTSTLIDNVFRSESNTGKRILGVLNTIMVFFLIWALASIVIGILLTKSITNAIHSLDRGTEFVKRGDFSHRIIVRSDDQLGALAASFNQMTEYVQHLVKELVQKERLDRELEIAKEVQEQLFPERAPEMSHMDIAGICLPARVVSGDYYDFLPLGKNELGLAVGDICGKGISAALLMANLQATLRSNVINLWRNNNSLNGKRTVAEIVRNLNNQIFSYTSANKFATFFYAVYNDSQKTLTYCNAGHNPPLYFRGDSVERLRSGGMVVGVFADSQYDQETIDLNIGDLLLAYTDGIVESINEYGEEFGEERLVQLVRKNRHLDANAIKTAIVDDVISWTFAEERDDDMTLIVAKMI
jgi:phosphoserine phosphatase RsbU/P